MVITEKQRFTQLWIWIPLVLQVAVILLLFYGLGLIRVVQGALYMDWKAIGVISVLLAVMLLLATATLKVMYNSEGIEYTFSPFILTKRKIAWEEVDKAYLRKYDAISEYGGFGLRSSKKRGKAYNTVGNVGLQLELKNGKRILFGTSKSEELEHLLATMPSLQSQLH